MLRLRDVHGGYGTLEVLSGVSMEVEKGEIVSVIGSNGAGKTTLTKVVSGVLKPTSGSIYLFDQNLSGLPSHKIAENGISCVMEGGRTLPLLSIKENLEIAGYLVKDKEKRREAIEWIFDIFPVLKERKKQKAETLSGGERQMLCIAGGLMLNPKILILDEPSLGLMPTAIKMVIDTVRTLNDKGLTILLVEQRVKEALNLADRAYVLENGKIVLTGMGRELLANQMVKRAYLGT